MCETRRAQVFYRVLVPRRLSPKASVVNAKFSMHRGFFKRSSLARMEWRLHAEAVVTDEVGSTSLWLKLDTHCTRGSKAAMLMLFGPLAVIASILINIVSKECLV